MNPDVHVLPVDDLLQHCETRTCWCYPRLIVETRAMVVVHRSADGRELIERHGIN